MPYLEPILARTEICNDNWIPWQSLAEKRNEKAGGEVCSDVTVFPSHASGDEDSSDKHQHSQELVQQVVTVGRCGGEGNRCGPGCYWGSLFLQFISILLS